MTMVATFLTPPLLERLLTRFNVQDVVPELPPHPTNALPDGQRAR